MKYLLLIFLIINIASVAAKADMLTDQNKTLQLHEECEEYIKSGTETIKGQNCRNYIYGFLDARYVAWSSTPGGVEKYQPYLFCISEDTTIVTVIKEFLNYNKGWTKNVNNAKYLGLSAALSDRFPCFKKGERLFPD